MDREKLIEEMARKIQQGELRAQRDMSYHENFNFDTVIEIGQQRLYGAKALYEDNYRKIPEGAVVLTREELVSTMESGYVYDTTTDGKINIIEMAREIERKETAMEILNDIFSDIHRIEIGSNQYILTEKDKKRIAKKFGAEVEE